MALTTSFTPPTLVVSSAAVVRAVSLLTLPFRVTTPLRTLGWIGWVAMEASALKAALTFLVSVASSGRFLAAADSG
jgi:hypothetical protein